MQARQGSKLQWERIREHFHNAVELEPAERELYLQSACGDDVLLRGEVRALLVEHDNVTGLLATGPSEIPATRFVLSPGDCLAGRFEIIRPLGAGGMGEVYEAHDRELGARVALKTLRPELVHDPKNRERFKHEILNGRKVTHPNICRIYDLAPDHAHEGFLAFTMELLGGETLAAYLEHQPDKRLPVDEALSLARQMAAGLDALHEQDIIHRDFKPGNIILVRQGGSAQVRITDFGLARSTDVSGPALSGSRDIVGTPIYMAPEQLMGERAKVSPATDVYALGLVLYEMVTGTRAYPAETLSENILQKTQGPPAPPHERVPELDENWDSTIQQCLAVDPKARPQSPKRVLDMLEGRLQSPAAVRRSARVSPEIGEVMPALKKVLPSEQPGGSPSQIDPSPRVRPGAYRWLPYLLAVGAVVILLVAAPWIFNRFSTSQRGSGTQLQLSPLTSLEGSEHSATFSPDGNQFAFSWDGGPRRDYDIYVQVIGSGNLLRLTEDPADDVAPTWSPDGRKLAFLRSIGASITDRGAIYLISPLGGAERRLAEGVLPLISDLGGLSWTPDARFLVFSKADGPGEQPGIYMLDVETEELRRLTSPPKGSLGDFEPRISPDGTTLAFARMMAGIAGIYLAPVSGGSPRPLFSGTGTIRGLDWTPDGKEVVYSWGLLGQSHRLWTVSAAGGSPQPLASAGEDGLSPVISGPSGRLIYTRSTPDRNIWRYVMPGSGVDPAVPTKVIRSTRDERSPQIAPDGRRIAFVSNRSGNSEVWTSGIDGSDAIQLTSSPDSFSGSPRWSPNGRSIAFDSLREGSWNVYTVDAQGGSPRGIVIRDGNDSRPSWSADGKWVYFNSDVTTPQEVWKAPIEGGKPVPVTSQGGYNPFESPDGRYLYYGKRGQPGLWRMPTAGGPETIVIDSFDAADQGFWDLAEHGVYFLARRTDPSGASNWLLKFLRFDTQKINDVVGLGQDPGRTATPFDVSPDGEWFVYTQIDQSDSDLIIVDNFWPGTK